ncbi:uncharacterized protein LOC131682298 [Topomyia yanbarensis]|uniref:uncharacterized protein LOC131682298 n=1 Tax=Topomyia yanbarensis TaxID=2498891 RepID=UPI00273C9CB7|nr:uncharacterized protein LOC131682298 [Topomyia yanbarensis]
MMFRAAACNESTKDVLVWKKRVYMLWQFIHFVCQPSGTTPPKNVDDEICRQHTTRNVIRRIIRTLHVIPGVSECQQLDFRCAIAHKRLPSVWGCCDPVQCDRRVRPEPARISLHPQRCGYSSIEFGTQ